jgi:hypothetical protein
VRVLQGNDAAADDRDEPRNHVTTHALSRNVRFITEAVSIVEPLLVGSSEDAVLITRRANIIASLHLISDFWP